MMTHTEVSFYMSYMMGVSKANLIEYGYAYPLVITLTKGNDTPPEIEHELVRDKARFVFKGNTQVTDEYLHNTEDLVYCHVIMLHVYSAKDEKENDPIIKTIQRTSQPDAVGYIACCLYREQFNEEEHNLSVFTDPESVRIMHTTYYLKDDPVRRDYILTYINRGEFPKTEVPAWEQPYKKDEGGIKKNYDIFAAHSGWYVPKGSDLKKIKNPYRSK